MDKPREYPGPEVEFREYIENVEYNDIDQELASDTWSKLIDGLMEVKEDEATFVNSSDGSKYVAIYKNADENFDFPRFDIGGESPDGKEVDFDLLDKKDKDKSVIQLLVEEGQVPLSKKEIETHLNKILSGKVKDLSK